MIYRMLRRYFSTMTVQVEEVVEVFRSVARHPSPTGATILKGNQGGFAIVSTWSQRSLEHGRRVKFQLTNLIDSSLNQPISTLPVDVSSVVLSSISKSEKLKAVIQEITAENSPKKYVLEIWRTHQLWRSFDLTSLDVHGDVYYDPTFGCLEWSPCEKKLLYVAEAKKPKAEPFFKLKSGSKESESKPGEPKPLKGEEYVYREEWGEQMVGKHQPCLVVCDIDSESISVCSGVPAEYSPGSAVWSPEGHIVGVCVQNTPRRLGIIYCTNRPSYIFQLTLDGSFKIISNKKMSARSPRFSPDGKVLVYLERFPTGAHRACQQIVKYQWSSGNSEVIFDIVSHQKTICNDKIFYGVFCDSLPKRCFSKDSKYIVFSSEQKFQISSYILDIESGSLNQLVVNEKGSVHVLDVDEDLVVCSKSSFVIPASLIVSYLSFDGITLWTPLTDWCQDVSPNNLTTQYMSLTAPNSEEVNSFSAIYYGPETGEPHSVPLIVFCHGGPHASVPDSFEVFSADYYTRLGFATLFPNYRGSTGQGQASIDFLLGKIGDTDVKDVHQATCEALKTFPCLNPNAVVLSGGSHGGFLVAHLSAQYPNFYKAVVSRNPALELSSMFVTSDIPDWCSNEAGFFYKGWSEDSTLWERMRNVSPMKLVDKICAPTLFLIGKNDLRVPPSQGIALYHALKERNVETKMHVYADNHPLASIPVELDSCINAALWLIQHIESGIILDIVRHQKMICDNRLFHGVFCNALPRRCFSKNSRYIVFSTEQRCAVVPYMLDTESGNLKEIIGTGVGSVYVLDVEEDLLVCANSSVSSPFLLITSYVSFEGNSYKWKPLSDPCGGDGYSLTPYYMSITTSCDDDVNTFPALYLGPETGEPHSVPLVVFPHGGPHSVAVDSFDLFSAVFYSRLGFATLFPNYRGSTGQGQASIDYLSGRVGDSDVKDVHQATLKALETFSCLNPNAVVLNGASHGGFLVTHLSAKHPTFYKAVVARSPPVELCSMFVTSDIPDKRPHDVGLAYKGWSSDSSFWEKMRTASPITLVGEIRVPTLLLVGKNDRRVPPSQGIALYHALKERNVKTKLHLYPDNHPLGSVPVELDSCINAALWLIQHLGVELVTPPAWRLRKKKSLHDV